MPFIPILLPLRIHIPPMSRRAIGRQRMVSPSLRRGVAARLAGAGRRDVLGELRRHLWSQRRPAPAGPLGVHRHRAGPRAGSVRRPVTFAPSIAVGDRIGTSTAAASGPVAALTAMLHERGITVETLRFHQIRSAGTHRHFHPAAPTGSAPSGRWGWSEDPTQSALRAVIACANRLARLPKVDAESASADIRVGQRPSKAQSGRSTIGMPSFGTGMPP